MAKLSGKPKGRPKSATPKPRTPIVVTIRANAEWEAWIDKFCEAIRINAGMPAGVKIDRTVAIDMGLGKLAAAMKFPEPPARF